MSLINNIVKQGLIRDFLSVKYLKSCIIFKFCSFSVIASTYLGLLNKFLYSMRFFTQKVQNCLSLNKSSLKDLHLYVWIVAKKGIISNFLFLSRLLSSKVHVCNKKQNILWPSTEVGKWNGKNKWIGNMDKYWHLQGTFCWQLWCIFLM